MTNEKVVLPPMRRLGVENWTPGDFAEDARRRKAVDEVRILRKKALTDRGWQLHYRHCSRDRNGEWALDPLTGDRVSHEDAYLLQEAREPGSVPSWPKFDSNWKPPPSTEGLLHIGEVQVQPMEAPSGLVFYQDYKYIDEGESNA